MLNVTVGIRFVIYIYRKDWDLKPKSLRNITIVIIIIINNNYMKTSMKSQDIIGVDV